MQYRHFQIGLCPVKPGTRHRYNPVIIPAHPGIESPTISARTSNHRKRRLRNRQFRDLTTVAGPQITTTRPKNQPVRRQASQPVRKLCPMVGRPQHHKPTDTIVAIIRHPLPNNQPPHTVSDKRNPLDPLQRPHNFIKKDCTPSQPLTSTRIIKRNHQIAIRFEPISNLQHRLRRTHNPVKQNHRMPGHRGQSRLLTNLSQTSLTLFTTPPRMTIISRIQKPIMPRDDILLNRPPSKKQNITPELTPSKSLHANSPPFSNPFTAATLRHEAADTKRHNKRETTRHNLKSHESSHTKPQPRQQRAARESFHTSPQELRNTLYSGLTA